MNTAYKAIIVAVAAIVVAMIGGIVAFILMMWMVSEMFSG